MPHMPAFVIDLALILATAGFSIIICRRFKQPVVLGYIISGFLVGPYFPLLPDVRDFKSITVWADLGVIFLLFTIGLEFSYKKLATIGKSALLVAIIKVFFVMGLGYFLGQMFGWKWLDCIFLGAILTISSTTLVVRAFEEMGIKKSPFVDFIYAILIAEDLVAIVLLVFLSTISVSKTFTGLQLAGVLSQLFFFLILCFILGLYFVPLLIRKAKNFLNDETTLILSLGLCFLMVILADMVGFSPALGAFIIGSIFAETPISNNIEKIMTPIKHLFAAIFFVSIGILFDPTIFRNHYDYVIIITLATVLGKFISTLLGSIITGQSLRTSIHSGMSLAQIGEFSFIIATLGVTLKATDPILYPLAVAVCVITSFITPYLMDWSDPLYHFVSRKIPPVFLRNLETYSQAVQEQKSSNNFLTMLWELYGLKIVLNSTIIISIALLYGKVLLSFLRTHFELSWMMESVLLCMSLFTALPFFWPVLFGKPKRSIYLETTFEQAQRLHIGITICRSLLGILLLSFIIGQFSSLAAASSLLLLGLMIIFVPLTSQAETLYRFFERVFMENLNKDK